MFLHFNDLVNILPMFLLILVLIKICKVVVVCLCIFVLRVGVEASADLEVQLMQQNHCDGVLSNDWNTLLGQQISQHTAMSMSRSALDNLLSRIQGNNKKQRKDSQEVKIS